MYFSCGSHSSAHGAMATTTVQKATFKIYDLQDILYVLKGIHINPIQFFFISRLLYLYEVVYKSSYV